MPSSAIRNSPPYRRSACQVAFLCGAGATVDRLLLQCLRASGSPSVSVDLALLADVDPDLARWRAGAAWHRVDPWAWLAVKESGLAETDAGHDLAQRYDYGVARHLRMVDDLRTVAGVLRDAGVDFAVFKGAVLAELAYPRPDLRAYNDLDLLVAPDRFAAALDVLQAAGCRLLDRNWRLLGDEGAGQVHLLTPMQTVIDLHWNLLNTPANRRDFPISTRDVLGRASLCVVRDVRVPVLHPADMLTHLCLHACLAGANRLCWLKDIAQVLIVGPTNWDDVATRARHWEAQVPVGVALTRAMRVFATPVESEVVRDLVRSRSLRLVLAGVDRAFPSYRTHRGGSVNRVVARAARSGGAATWAQLVRRASSAVVKGGPLRTERHAWEIADADPRSSRFGAGSLAEYLSFVEAQQP